MRVELASYLLLVLLELVVLALAKWVAGDVELLQSCDVVGQLGGNPLDLVVLEVQNLELWDELELCGNGGDLVVVQVDDLYLVVWRSMVVRQNRDEHAGRAGCERTDMNKQTSRA